MSKTVDQKIAADIIKTIHDTLSEDKEFQELIKKRDVEAAFCSSCRKEAPVDYYPHWHIFRRRLCGECGEKYSSMLRNIGAWDR